MAIKRSELIDTENAGFYHLISRCVRRAFLCGVDEESGKDYEHRRQWLEVRILSLANIFAIEVLVRAFNLEGLLKKAAWLVAVQLMNQRW